MRTISLLISLVILFSGAIAQTPYDKTDLQRKSLKGKVKSVTQVSFRTKVDTSTKSILKIPVTKGKDPNDEEYTVYNTGGNKVVDYHYAEKNELRMRDTVIYNKEGKRLLDSTSFPHLKSWMKSIYTYNDKGQLTESNHTSDDGMLKGVKGAHHMDSASKYICHYDDKGVKIGEDEYVNGNLDHKNVYTSDDKGWIIETKIFSPAGVLTADNKNEKEFDADGNMTISRTYDKDGKLTYSSIRTYNEHGDPVKSITDDSSDDYHSDVETKYFEYDKQGNWTKCTSRFTTRSYTFDLIQQRTIKYY